jgi:hypothetical protein
LKNTTLPKGQWQVLGLFFLVLASRIPFLFIGYGAEEDSWGTPLAIWQTIETGIYEPSRLPGHPVQEAFYLLIPSLSPFWWNLLSALACAWSSVAFFKIFQKLELEWAFLSGLALAFVPIVYISSTYTIDFCFTLSFLLWSFFYLLERKYLISGLIVGLAIGCRITTGVFIIPFAIWIFLNERKDFSSQSLVKFGLIGILVGVLTYLPLVLTFGYRFFQYYDQFPYPSWEKVIYKASFGVWGAIGLLGMISATLSQLVFGGFSRIQGQSDRNKSLVGLALLILGLFTFSYLRLPQKSGYWILLIPFVILALRVSLLDMLYKFVICCFLASSFLFSLGLTDAKRGSDYSAWAKVHKVGDQTVFFDPITGPLYSDLSKRRNKEAFCREVVEELSSPQHTTSVVICGWWYNELMVYAKQNNPSLIPHLRFYAKQDELERVASKQLNWYFLPEQEKYNDLYSQISTTQQFAKPWINEAQHER